MSYSHKDEALVERLLAHLLVLQTYGIARIFYDQEIQRGEKWRDRILEEIDGATVIICLLSADYLSSEFVNSDEIPRIRERQAAGVPVIPVLLRSCPWQVCDWLEERQLFTLNGKALDLGKPKEVEQRFADLTLEVFHLMAEHPDFDPPGAAQADAAEETATEPDVRGTEEAKVLKAKDRFRRKALAESEVRSALERLIAERVQEVPREVVVREAPRYLILGGGRVGYLSSALYEWLAAGDHLDTALRGPEDGLVSAAWGLDSPAPAAQRPRSRFIFRCARGAGYELDIYYPPKTDADWDDRASRLPDLGDGFAGNIYTSDVNVKVGHGNADGAPLWSLYWEALFSDLLRVRVAPVVHDYWCDEERSEQLAWRSLLHNACVTWAGTPIRIFYTSGSRWAEASDSKHTDLGGRDECGWSVGIAGAATNSGSIIKTVLPDVSLWNVDEGAVLRFERDSDWWSSAPASSFQARSPYRWGPFVFQDDWLCSPGINYDLIDGTLDGIPLPNDVPDFSRDERRGPYPVAAWGDIGSLSAGNGEAQYVC